MNMRNTRRKRGFSLVEVCLAVLVVGLGILSIFGLFPTGLAASEDAEKDTTGGLFANQAINSLQARADDLKPRSDDAQGIRDAWAAWANDPFVGNPYRKGVVLLDSVAYSLTVDTPVNKKVKWVTLYVLPWTGDTPPPLAVIQDKGLVFYTELYFTVLP